MAMVLRRCGGVAVRQWRCGGAAVWRCGGGAVARLLSSPHLSVAHPGVGGVRAHLRELERIKLAGRRDDTLGHLQGVVVGVGVNGARGAGGMSL